jgi:hypothetical protein
MKVLVTLTPDELERAAMGGVQRRINGLVKNRRSTHPETPDHEQNWWESHIVGAIGEYAVAKALGQHWRPTVGQIDQKDVGEFEVRTTQLPKPLLRYRGHNDPNSKYILCSYRGTQVLIQGWLPGYTVQKLGYEEYDNVWTAGVDQLYSLADINAEICWSDTVVPYGRAKVC